MTRLLDMSAELAKLRTSDADTAVALGTKQDITQRGVASGYAPLDGSGKVPVTNIAAHASTHQNGGADEVATATAGANAIPKAGSSGVLSYAWMPFQSGQATLVAGVATVSASYVSTSAGACSIILTRATVGPKPGELSAAPADFVDATSFVIRSTGGALDTGTVWWQVWRTV